MVALKNREYFLKHNNKAKMLVLTAAKKTRWILFWICHIVTVPNNQCLLHWGYKIFLCPTFAWLSLIPATSVPPFLACLSLFCASSNFSFLFLIMSQEGFCISILHSMLHCCFYVLHNSTYACRFLHDLAFMILLLVSVHASVLHSELDSKF